MTSIDWRVFEECFFAVVPAVVKPPQPEGHPMKNPAETTPVETNERISTACASASEVLGKTGLDAALDLERSAPRSASGEARHPPVVWDLGLRSAPLGSVQACACRQSALNGTHSPTVCHASFPARDAGPIVNATVAARWARLAEVVDLPPDEMLKLTFAELALILESRVMRLRHQALAAGAPAVAGEFYVACGGCGCPVDVRDPHSVGCVDCARRAGVDPELVTCSNAERA